MWWSGLPARPARGCVPGRPGAPNCLTEPPTGSLGVMRSVSPEQGGRAGGGGRWRPPQGDTQAGALRGKHPQEKGVQRAWPGWAWGDVGPEPGLQDMVLEKGLALSGKSRSWGPNASRPFHIGTLPPSLSPLGLGGLRLRP